MSRAPGRHPFHEPAPSIHHNRRRKCHRSPATLSAQHAGTPVLASMAPFQTTLAGQQPTGRLHQRQYAKSLAARTVLHEDVSVMRNIAPFSTVRAESGSGFRVTTRDGLARPGSGRRPAVGTCARIVALTLLPSCRSLRNTARCRSYGECFKRLLTLASSRAVFMPQRTDRIACVCVVA